MEEYISMAELLYIVLIFSILLLTIFLASVLLNLSKLLKRMEQSAEDMNEITEQVKKFVIIPAEIIEKVKDKMEKHRRSKKDK